MVIEANFKPSDIGLIPQDWELKSLGDIGQSLIGLTYKPNNVKEDGILVLRSSNIQDGQLSFEDNVYVDAEVPERIMVREGDILICVRNGSRDLIGKCAKLDDRTKGMTFGAFMAVYRTIFHDVIFHAFQSNIIKKQIHEHLGATINQITNKSLNSFRIALPPKNSEQQAIATALSDADALIAELDRLITKKRNLKQATMQQLLTGKTRLPGFSGEWRKVPLGDIAYINMGQSPDSKYYNTASNGLPLIQGNADIDNRKSVIRFWTSQITKQCHAGDIIITVRAPVGYVGIASVDSCIGRGVCSLHSLRANKYFLFQYLIYKESEWKILEQGSTFTSANSAQIKAFSLLIPHCEQEQAKIAEVLNDIDSELILLYQRLHKVKNIKQGMMQELLTGRIRLV